MDSRPTASIIIIGDEILKGHTKDSNSHFLCRELYECGVRVPSVTIIPDNIEDIATEVMVHSQKHTYVLTSGGIGPTHDDVTYEGVAKAFDETLVLNKDLQTIFLQLCHNMGLDHSAVRKMSHVPQSAVIHRTSDPYTNNFIPIVSVRNVFIFPGIPSYLEFTFLKLKSLFCGTALPYFSRDLYVNVNEFEISETLNSAFKEFEPKVRLGSYPDVENKHFQVKLTLEADSGGAIAQAEDFLRSHLPQNSVVGQHPPNSEEALKLFLSVLNKRKNATEFVVPLKESMKILEECFSKYTSDELCISFNGGKDCTVLLHLTYLFLRKLFPKNVPRLKVLYVRGDEPFPEIEEFIELSIKRYNLELLSYKQPIKEALWTLKSDKPKIQAVLMGCRRTDPHCSELLPFQMTDSDWPQYMRINPLSDWSYSHVWDFLRNLEVPYCSLYDKGYTSLGCLHNTIPNKQLLAETKSGEPYYVPAYLLKNPDQEREGRATKQ